MAFPGIEQKIAWQFGEFTAQEGQHHNAPSDHRIEGDGTGQDFGGVILVLQYPAAVELSPLPRKAAGGEGFLDTAVHGQEG